jgi:hypothetical protein
VVKQAAFAEAGATIIATELIAVSNVIPAFAAFYGSVDELKHQRFVIQSRGSKKERKGDSALHQLRLSTVSLHPAMKKAARRNFFRLASTPGAAKLVD